MHASQGRRPGDVFVSRIWFADGDVVTDGASEQRAFLRDEADPAGELGAGELADVSPVEQDATVARPVQSLHQLQQRALARPVAANERGDAARQKRQSEIADHRPVPGRIGEADVLEQQHACRPLQPDSARRALALRRKYLTQALHRLQAGGIRAPVADHLVEQA
jgi:hypothetical protein